MVGRGDNYVANRESQFRREALRSRPIASSMLLCLLPTAYCLLLSGCANAVQAGTNTALDGIDLVEMTDRMAQSIAGDPDVRAAIAKEGAMRVVCQPVENEMTAEVLPRGQAEAFVARVRTLLSKQAKNDFVWIMNREAFYHLRERELEGVDLGPSPDAVQPQYALTARFNSLTKESAKGRSSYYLCTYQLTNLDDRTVLWTDKYEVKKQAVRGFLD
jgi:hypothetical protein